MGGDEGPVDPIRGMVSDAVALHEMFQSIRAGGFTEDQALRLLAYTLRPDLPEPPS